MNSKVTAERNRNRLTMAKTKEMSKEDIEAYNYNIKLRLAHLKDVLEHIRTSDNHGRNVNYSIVTNWTSRIERRLLTFEEVKKCGQGLDRVEAWVYRIINQTVFRKHHTNARRGLDTIPVKLVEQKPKRCLDCDSRYYIQDAKYCGFEGVEKKCNVAGHNPIPSWCPWRKITT